MRATFRYVIPILGLIVPGLGMAQHHHHPPQHAAIHEQFYSSWFRPDDRRFSCCNLKDCEPVQARKASNGQWEILRPADQKWLKVPWTQVETERDSPDGRNHGCFQAPGMSDTVFCFLPAGGT